MAWLEAAFWLSLLALQFGLQPSISARFASKEVIGSSAIIAQEGLLKVAFGLQALILESGLKPLQTWSFSNSLKRAGAPAVIYALQNLLTYSAYNYVDGLTYNIVNQSKIIWSAVLVWLFLGEGLSARQILSLCLIISATLLVTTGPSKSSEDPKDGSNYVFGLGLTLTASMLSGIASTLMQYNLQRLKMNSYLMSAELGCYSAVFLIMKVIVEAALGAGDGYRIRETSFFEGFTKWTWLPLILSAFGGIVVGQVTKHVGSVGKSYGLLAGLTLSAFTNTGRITWRLGLALPLILLGFWFKFAGKETSKRASDQSLRVHSRGRR